MRPSQLLVPFMLGAAVATVLGVRGEQAKGRLVFVGTYTNAHSLGIYAFRFDEATGALLPLGLAAETRNPSFLAASHDGRFLFALNEVDDYGGERSGSVTSFEIDRDTGKLRPLSVQSSRGADPCHLALDRTGRFLAVANYSGGNVAILPIGTDGKLGPAASVVQHEGRGADPRRQEGPHAHQVSFSADNRFLIAADLGLDQLVVYRFDKVDGSLMRHDPPGVSLAPGAGPRHFAFHPDGSRAYAINELNSTITSLSWDAESGVFTTRRSFPSLPPGFEGRNSTAEIALHPSGRFVYGSNRGHDSVAVLSIQDDGRLSLVEAVPTRGRGPRHFAITESGHWLVAANQSSGTLAVFRMDGRTGGLTPVGPLVAAGTPVCVLFVE